MPTTTVLTVDGVLQPRRFTAALWEFHERISQLPNIHAIHTTWRDDPLRIASQIANELDVDRIFCKGHSAGGKFCNDVCVELEDFGRTVDGLFLADAWRKSGPIVVPANVKRLWSYRQCKGIPRGSEIQLVDASATEWVVNETGLPVGHAKVDEWMCERGVLWKLLAEGE